MRIELSRITREEQSDRNSFYEQGFPENTYFAEGHFNDCGEQPYRRSVKPIYEHRRITWNYVGVYGRCLGLGSMKPTPEIYAITPFVLIVEWEAPKRQTYARNGRVEPSIQTPGNRTS